MSKHVPMLKLHDVSTATESTLLPNDALYQPAIHEIEKYSITPRVLRTKTFFVKDANDTMPAASREEYQYNGNEVIKFCINVQNLQTDIANSTILGANVTFTPSGNNVSANTTNYLPADAQASILHSIEKAALMSALRDTNPIILVDIFERTNGQSINLDALNNPIVHTVLLYKALPARVLVIDPSNFVFSSHLANNDFNTELTSNNLPNIETIHKKIQIYRPEKGALVGPAFDQYRDCSDVAVKLAFGFSHQPLTKFDQKSIEKHPAVIRLSNIDTIDKSIFDTKSVIRIKQTSSIKAQETFAMTQWSIDQKLKMTAQTHTHLNQKYKGEYKTVIETQNTNEMLLRDLLSLDANYNEDVALALNTTHQQLETANYEYSMELSGQTP